MLKTATLVIAGLVVGFAVAAWWGGDQPIGSSGMLGDAADWRLATLEAAIRDERRERLDLEAQFAALEERVAALPQLEIDTVTLDTAAPGARDPLAADSLADDDIPPPLRAELIGGPRARFGRDDAQLVERFLAAGISADRAQWIVRRTSELRMEALQAQYDAAREGVPLDQRADSAASNVLREELGDSDYERYLQALDRPTSVGVRDVLASSPAEQAGLQAGDQLVAYSGKRVFDMSDLNRLVLEGEPGEMVAVEVLRDGQPLQIYVPRGPIGITGGGMIGRRPGGR